MAHKHLYNLQTTTALRQRSFLQFTVPPEWIDAIHPKPKCYRARRLAGRGLVLFGTQPSSHVKVKIPIRAWLERLYPCHTLPCYDDLESLSHSTGITPLHCYILPGLKRLLETVQERNARMQSGKGQADDLISDKAAEGFLQTVLYSGICFWQNLPFRTQR